jgi:hypothetical protein
VCINQVRTFSWSDVYVEKESLLYVKFCHVKPAASPDIEFSATEVWNDGGNSNQAGSIENECIKEDIQSLSSHKNHPKQGEKTILTVTSRACKTPFCNFHMNTTYFYTKLDMENDFICV